MSLYLEWSKRVSGLSNGSVSIADSLPGLSLLAEGLLLDKDRVSVGSAFESLARKLKEGSYTEASWSQSDEWSRIKKAIEAGRSHRQGRDALLTEVGNQANAAGALAGRLEGRLTTAESGLEALKERAQKTGDLASSLEEKMKVLDSESMKAADFNSFKAGAFDQLTRRVNDKASELETLATLVKNEQSTWTDTGVPSPQSGESEISIKARTMPWGKGGDPSVHIGDTYIVTGTGSDRGRMYRFVRNSSGQYYWEKVADNDGTLALAQLAEEAAKRQKTIADLESSLKNEIGGVRNDLQTENKKRQQELESALEGSEQKLTADMMSQIKNRVTTLYTVKTFQEGSLVSGRIVSSAHDSSGGAVIRHTAVVRNLMGVNVTSSKGGSLQWKINKGRTSAPQERIVTGAQCDVSVSDLVQEAGVPAYYDIELYREF